MNAGNPKTSPHLSAILALLRSRGPTGATTLELQEVSNSMAVSTDVSAIRHNGYTIDCEYEDVRNGRKIYRYWLLDSPIVQGQLFAEGA
jgi:hypothetical protein